MVRSFGRWTSPPSASVVPSDDLEQRGLAGAVPAHERDPPAVGHLERDVPEQDPRAVGLRQPRDGDHRPITRRERPRRGAVRARRPFGSPRAGAVRARRPFGSPRAGAVRARRPFGSPRAVPIGSIRWGPLLRTLFTSVEMGWRVSRVSGAGTRSFRSAVEVLVVPVQPGLPRRRAAGSPASGRGSWPSWRWPTSSRSCSCGASPRRARRPCPATSTRGRPRPAARRRRGG